MTNLVPLGPLLLLGGVGLLLVGLGLGYFASQVARKTLQSQLEEEAQQQALRRLAEEERRQRLGFLEEKDQWYKLKAEQERELEERVLQTSQREKAVANRDRELSSQRDEVRKDLLDLKTQEKRLALRDKEARETEEELNQTMEAYCQRLELAANLTASEAREQLLEHLAGEVRARSAALIRAERLRAKEQSEAEAKKIIAQAIQRCAVEEVVQVSTSSVALPSEGLKSRIIGKEGRNVRAFETATGVKVVVDDTPDTVLLSCFDAAKREIASRAMERLIADGGFTPNRIEEVVEECRVVLEEDMAKVGRKALSEIGASEVDPELARFVGMLKYRTSFGQNLLQHSLEVAHLAGLMAAEIGLDVRLARRAGLLHDIGKTVSREMEGSHVDLGVELAERFGEHPVVKEVIAEHHEDSERMSPICFLVKASDTISSIRPGGRREDLEGYARRIMRLEEIANSFEGVRDVYAINAGREIRVMVRGDRVSDDAAEILAFDIAEKVKNELTFAGQVKVMVVRETQAVRYTGRNRNRRNHQRPALNRQRGRRPRSAVSHN